VIRPEGQEPPQVEAVRAHDDVGHDLADQLLPPSGIEPVQVPGDQAAVGDEGGLLIGLGAVAGDQLRDASAFVLYPRFLGGKRAIERVVASERDALRDVQPDEVVALRGDTLGGAFELGELCLGIDAMRIEPELRLFHGRFQQGGVADDAGDHRPDRVVDPTRQDAESAAGAAIARELVLAGGAAIHERAAVFDVAPQLPPAEATRRQPAEQIHVLARLAAPVGHVAVQLRLRPIEGGLRDYRRHRDLNPLALVAERV
jgi:hypothetical protein